MAILVIEDDPDLLEVLTFSLKRGGYEVIPASDGDSGLRFALSRVPQLVLLDIMLPKLDGWQVCKSVREASAMPIVMLSALDRPADIVRALDLGVDDFISKP